MPLPYVQQSEIVRWLSPGVWPPFGRTGEDYSPGYRRSFHHSPQPLIVQISPARSIVCINNMVRPYSDNGSVTVSETPDGLQISPGFNALARMRPQSTQTVGDSWLWIVDADAESALLRLHGLYGDVGFEAPDDRAEWLKPRSQLWYGLEPQRALMALSAFITGVPLVYHEAEDGRRAVFQRIFAIRKALPELNGGGVDYLSVKCPPGVFACLRYADGVASIVLINLDPSLSSYDALPVEVSYDLLERVLKRDLESVLWRGIGDGDCGSSGNAEGGILFDVSLAPYRYHILRSQPIPDQLKSLPDARISFPEWPGNEDERTTEPEPVDGWAVQSSSVELRLDEKTGLPKETWLHGEKCGGSWDLFLSNASAEPSVAELMRRDNGAVVSKRAYGDDRLLQMEYLPQVDRIEVKAIWRGKELPEHASLLVPFEKSRRWVACSAEGIFEDAFRARHVAGAGSIGSIYWHPQGTNVLWDSLLHPFSTTAAPAVGVLVENGSLGFVFSHGPVPCPTEEALGLNVWRVLGDRSIVLNPIPARVRL